jgi:hypothetical protein
MMDDQVHASRLRGKAIHMHQDEAPRRLTLHNYVEDNQLVPELQYIQIDTTTLQCSPLRTIC